MLGELAIRRDLAAERRQHRGTVRSRRAVQRIHLEHVVARDGGRIVGAVVVERTHAAVVPHDIARRQRLVEVGIDEIEEVARLVLADARMLEGLHRNVGGADQRVVLLVGNHEHDAIVRVLQDVGVLPAVHARHHDVAALHVPDVALAALGGTHEVEHLLDPRTRGVHEGTGGDLGGARRLRSRAWHATASPRDAPPRASCAPGCPRRAPWHRARWPPRAAHRPRAHRNTRSPCGSDASAPTHRDCRSRLTPNELGSVLRPPRWS